MNFLKFFTKLSTIIILGGTLAFSAEVTKTVLVLGANQFHDDSWNMPLDNNGGVWPRILEVRGIELTTIDKDSTNQNAQYPNNCGSHNTFDWNNDSLLQENFVKKHKKYFDLITNDYCVSYFIHDRTLPSFLETLKVGGKFIYGPIMQHGMTVISQDDTRDQLSEFINVVTEDNDISFYRDSLALQKGTDGTVAVFIPFRIAMTGDYQKLQDIYLRCIDEWPGADFENLPDVPECRVLLKSFVNSSYERMTLDNFTKFINDKCGFKVDVEVKSSDDGEIQYIFNHILPPNHPKACCGQGDWIIMTRMGD